jgi:hypothetical protein
LQFHPPVSQRSGPSRVTAIPATIAAAAVALGSLAAACGEGSDTNSIAHLGSTPTTTSGANTGASRSRDDRNVLVAFAVCMRRHGLPNFPDPRADSNGYHLRYGAENGIDPRSSQFTNAQQAWRLLPNGGRQSSQEQAKELQAGLEYAVCMRAHGVSKFPKGLERWRDRIRRRPEVACEPRLASVQGRREGVSTPTAWVSRRRVNP